jgi:ATP-dependent Lon protease
MNILRWIEDGEDALANPLAALRMSDPFSDVNEAFEEEIKSVGEQSLDLPEELPILPLRGLVVYPQTVVPLTVGQPRSIRLIDDAVASQRMIGLLTSKDADLETPGPEHLNLVGTVATIHRLFRAPDGTIRLLVQGLGRFAVDEFTQLEPYLQAKVTARPEITETGLEVEALARNARDQFEHIAEMIPSIPREVVASISAITDPLQTVYTIANFQRMDLTEAQNILEIDSISDKLRRLVNILTRETEVLDLGQKIQNEARSEIEKVQRDYFLREQLKAIQKELGEGDEQVGHARGGRKTGAARVVAPVASAHGRRGIWRDPHLSGLAHQRAVEQNHCR